MFRYGRKLAWGVGGVGYFVQCLVLGAAPGDPGIRYAPDSTRAERVEASASSRPVEVDSVLLPYPNVAELISGPRPIPAGTQPLPGFVTGRDRLIWRLVPQTDMHTKYMAIRSLYLSEGKLEQLIDACLRAQLPACAEYELRGVLTRLKDFRKPEYQKCFKVWYGLAQRRQTEYSFPLPVAGEWFVVRKTSGQHGTNIGAAFSYDLVIKKGDKSYDGTGHQLSDHYCWGQPILSQADGVVLQATDSQPDAPVGQSGGSGNANVVVLDYGGGTYAVYAHIQEGSAKVKLGQHVKTGDPLALVGNSGASGFPHLHFTLTDSAGISVRGRFSYQCKRMGRWETVHGGDLKEDVSVLGGTPPGIKSHQ